MMVQKNNLSVCSHINSLCGAATAALATAVELLSLEISVSFFYLPDIEIFHVWEVSHKLILSGREQRKHFFEKCMGETFIEI